MFGGFYLLKTYTGDFSMGLVLAAAIISAVLLGASLFKIGSENKIACKIIGTILLTMSGALGFLSSITWVSTGHVGVKTKFGEVQEPPLSEGLHFIDPMCEVHELNLRTHTYTMSGTAEEGEVKRDDAIDAISNTGMAMKMEVSVPHRLLPSAAIWVFRNLGPSYEENIVRPAIATAVREATAKFTEEEAYASKREELAKTMKDRLNMQIKNIINSYDKSASRPEEIIVFPEVQLRKVGLPESVQTAINEKIATEQKIVQAKNEAKRKEIEAQGIKKFQDIVSQGITPDLLKWKGIEATEALANSPNAKIVVVPVGKELPVILSGPDEKK